MLPTAVSLLGHKDHGKSTLIGRLLVECGAATNERIEHAKYLSESMGKKFEYAFLLDSFQEERLGGLTIDTTSAKLSFRGKAFELIDVPGHKTLLKNMLSGTSNAEYAILVVSAKPGEGLQTETKLHLYLAGLLGLKRIIVAVTKLDLRDYSQEVFEDLEKSVLNYLEFAGFNQSQVRVIPVSSMEGANLAESSQLTPWFEGLPLLQEMNEFFVGGEGTGALSGLPLRFFVQDSIDVEGEKMVVGVVEQGVLKCGEKIFFEPGGSAGLVEEIHSFEKTHSEVKPGENAGLKIKFELGFAPKRGSVGFYGGARVVPSKAILARFFVLPNFSLDLSRPLAFKNFSGVLQVRVTKLVEKISVFEGVIEADPRAERAEATECFSAILHSEDPLVAEEFRKTPFLGRFVLLDGKKQIAAVGIVEKAGVVV